MTWSMVRLLDRSFIAAAQMVTTEGVVYYETVYFRIGGKLYSLVSSPPQR